MREIDCAPVFSPGEFLRHAAVKRAGAVKRQGGRYVLEFRGPQFRQKILHSLGFNLEYPHGRAFAKKGVDLGVVKGDSVKVEFLFIFCLVFPYVLNRLVQYGKGLQAEEVEFHVAELLYGVHVELGHDLVFASPVKRDVVGKRLVRYHHARRVGGGMAHHVLKRPRELHRFGKLLVLGKPLPYLLYLAYGLLYAEHLSPERGDHFREPVDFRVRKPQNPSHVLYHGFRGHGSEGADLGHLVRPVFLRDVPYYLVAVLPAEIDVYVGHAHPLGVKEPLENKVVPYGVDGRYAEGVGDQAPGGASPPRSHRDIVFLGVEYEVGHHEEVRGKSHLADGVKLRAKPLAVGIVSLFGHFVFPEHFLEIPARDLAHELIKRFSLGRDVFREPVPHVFELEIAALGDFHRLLERVLETLHVLGHLLPGLHVEVVAWKPHSFLVGHHASGLDAQKRVVRLVVLPSEKMAVVGRRELYAQALAYSPEPPVYPPLFLKTDCLHFKIVAVPEYLLVYRRDSCLLLKVLFENGLGEFAAHAPGEDYEPLVVLGQHLVINARTAVKPLEVTSRDEPREVPVSLLVHAEHGQVVVLSVGRLFKLKRRGHVEFAAYYGLYAPGLCLFEKLVRSEEVSVVGYGDGGHGVGLGPFDQFVELYRAVKKRVLRM